MYFRVRTLLRHLNYSDLRKRKILPKEALFTAPETKKGRVPYVAKKIGYSNFGLAMEKILEDALENPEWPPEKVIMYFLENTPSLQPFSKYFKPQEYSAFIKRGREIFEPKSLSYQEEWTANPIQGHPDMVCESLNTIYEMKTTGRFLAMRSDTILQLLCYFCLSQRLFSGRYTKVCLILPIQNLFLSYDLGEWNWEPFWEEMVRASEFEHTRTTKYISSSAEYLHYLLLSQSIGTHIAKDSLLKAIPTGRTLQFFVSGRQNSNVEVKVNFKKKLKEVLKNSSAKVFIHAPYTLNLSNPRGTPREGEAAATPWVCQKLIYLLKLGEECGLKGIVVHTGQWKQRGPDKLTFQEALFNMFDSICTIAPYASETCPLLIETPAGDKGEILWESRKFISFFMSLPLYVQKTVKICIDTCHVFAAGTDPHEYLLFALERNIQIGLIHYNDSYYAKGSKKDSHARVGNGEIGFNSMKQVLITAIQHRIPLVYE